MVDGSRYIFLLIRLVRRLLRATSGSRQTLFKLNGFQAIRRRFLEDIAEKTTVSPFPFLPPTEKLGALRAASIESHELFSSRGPMSLFGFRQLEWRERKALSFFLDHLRFLICVSQERSYTRSFKEATCMASYLGNFEWKHSSSPLHALRRLSPEHATSVRELSNAFAPAISGKVSVVCRHFEASIRKVNRSCGDPKNRIDSKAAYVVRMSTTFSYV